MNPKSVAISSFVLVSALASSAYACPPSTSELMYLAGLAGVAIASPYAVVTSLVLMKFRHRWLEGSWKRWLRQSALSFVLAGLGLGIGTASGLILVNPNGFFGISNQAAYFTVIFTTPLLLLAGQLAMLRARGCQSDDPSLKDAEAASA